MPILMVHEIECDKSKEQQEDGVASIAAEQGLTQELVRGARTVKLKPLSKTSILVATKAKSIVRLNSFMEFKQEGLCKVVRDVMNLYPQRFF